MSKILAGVMGWPVGHSLSPKLHGYWLKKYKIDGSYVPLAVKPDELREALKSLRGKGFRGVNLTVPHKEAALALVDCIDPAAKRIGAVNTVVVQNDGTLEGRNTDAYGFAQNLLGGGYKPGRSAVVLGAGGAARAVTAALQDMGVQDIRILNRTFGKAEALAQEFSSMEQSHFLSPEEPAEEAMRHIRRVTAVAWGDTACFTGAGLLVNATVLGMKGQPPLDINLDTLPPNAFVTDIVYAPLKTELLKQAESRGHKIIDGLGMLLHQARPAFRAFFGVDPEVTIELRRHVLEGL